MGFSHCVSLVLAKFGPNSNSIASRNNEWRICERLLQDIEETDYLGCLTGRSRPQGDLDERLYGRQLPKSIRIGQTKQPSKFNQ